MLSIVCGPSTIGKNRLINTLIERDLARFLTPFTDRLPRSGEKQGIDYHFLSTSEFQERILAGFFDEWDYAIGNYYGCADIAAHVRSADVHVMHALSRIALRLRARHSNIRLVSLVPSDESVLMERLSARSSTPDEAALRRAHVQEESVHSALFDVTISGAESLAGPSLDDAMAQIVSP